MTNKKILLCATSNSQKFTLGRLAFAKYDIALEQVMIEVDEIQGEDQQVILKDKAKKAFAAVGQPVLVSDDCWSIPALNGFPGAYMKSMNHWFEPQDFIRLMDGKDDRTIYLDQNLAYIDDDGIVTFSKRLKGIIVKEPKGTTGPPIMHVVELEDDGMTVAEAFDKGLANRHGTERDAWKDAAIWFAAKHSSV